MGTELRFSQSSLTSFFFLAACWEREFSELANGTNNSFEIRINGFCTLRKPWGQSISILTKQNVYSKISLLSSQSQERTNI